MVASPNRNMPLPSDLRQIMRENGDESTPVWITEMGWPTQVGATDEAEQARLAGIREGLATLEKVEIRFYRSRTDAQNSARDEPELAELIDRAIDDGFRLVEQDEHLVIAERSEIVGNRRRDCCTPPSSVSSLGPIAPAAGVASI